MNTLKRLYRKLETKHRQQARLHTKLDDLDMEIDNLYIEIKLRENDGAEDWGEYEDF